ncbi:MAG: type 1 glutamine amidotransferase [Betaproteobacteria bacterium]|jgi:GMP synthase-like glutamine amidotransferase|nr:type 1 glutamine amidotransferase [Betaproteobacteria bacterium]
MRPVAIFRFSPGDEPGRFAHWLDAHGVPWRLIALHEGEVVPADARAFAGIGTMGGPMSVNDALPWVAPMEALMRDAVAAGVPVIGHCLGGQLLAKALGAKVGTARTTEIGWIDVEATDDAAAGEWFGGRTRFATFEWHYEAFELPPGAQRVLTNAFNENQGYVIDGRHVGFQGHVEMTAEIARGWIANSPDELPASSDASMQSAADILANLDARVAALNAVADAIYSRWATNLWH